MASKKFSYKLISEPNPLEPLIKEFKALSKEVADLIELLEKLKQAFAKVASEIPLDGYKEMNKFTIAIDNLNKKSKAQLDLEKKLAKSQSQLASLIDDTTGEVSEQAVAQEKLKLQMAETRKEAKRIAQEQMQGSNAYKELAARSNEAQANFKKLAAQFGSTSKEAQEALSTFTELNDELQAIDKAARDGRRLVGTYEDAIEKAAKKNGLFVASTKKASKAARAFGHVLKGLGIGAIIAGMAALNKAFERSDQGAAAGQKTMARFQNTATVFISRLFEAIPKIFAKIQALGKRMQIIGAEVGLALSKAINLVLTGINKIVSVLTLGKVENAVGNLNKQIANSTKNIAKLNGELVGLDKAGDGLADSFKGMGDEIAKLNAASDERIEKQLAYTRSISESQKAIAGYNKQLSQLQQISENDGENMQKRLTAMKAQIPVLKQLAAETVSIAKKEADLAALRFTESGGVIDDNGIANSATGAAQAYAEYQAALAGVINAEMEAQEQTRDLLERTNTLRLDILDQQLDFALDNADNIKTVNERVIANENATMAEREAAIKANTELVQASFDSQLETVNNHQKAMKRATVDFNELLRFEGDDKSMLEYLDNLGVEERLSLRILEIVKERRTFLQDLTETQQEYAETQREVAALDADIALQQEALMKLSKENADFEAVAAELEQKRTEQSIENLREQLAAAKENSERYKEIQQELNDALLDQQLERLRKEAEAEKKALDAREKAAKEAGKAAADALKKQLEKQKELEQERIKLIKDTLNQINEAVDRAFEKRAETIDKEIDKNQERKDRLAELAAQGNQLAEENLARAQKREAELERKRIQNARREQNAKLALAAVETYIDNAQASEQGGGNALAKTIAEISLLKGFIDNLPAFYQGTDNVAKDPQIQQVASGRDGYVVRVDGPERIIGSDLSKSLPQNITNRQIVEIVNQHVNGAGGYKVFNNTVSMHGVTKRLDKLTKVVQKQGGGAMDFVNVEKAVVQKVRNGDKIERRHYSRRGF